MVYVVKWNISKNKEMSVFCRNSGSKVHPQAAVSNNQSMNDNVNIEWH